MEMPNWTGETLDQEPPKSATEVLQEAIEELKKRVTESKSKEDAEELSVLRMAASALEKNDGEREEAIAWLKKEAEVTVNMKPEAVEAAVRWLEHL